LGPIDRRWACTRATRRSPFTHPSLTPRSPFTHPLLTLHSPLAHPREQGARCECLMRHSVGEREGELWADFASLVLPSVQRFDLHLRLFSPQTVHSLRFRHPFSLPYRVTHFDSLRSVSNTTFKMLRLALRTSVQKFQPPSKVTRVTCKSGYHLFCIALLTPPGED